MCWGESVVQIGIGNGPSVAVRALVVDKALFEYDLLLGLNAIRQLGGPKGSKIKLPFLNETLSALKCVQIAGGSKSLFCERGAPVELLTDNATTFSGETFSRFAERWGVRIRFRCAYVPAGNGIVERSHRTIERITARTRYSVMEAVYWYNVTPKDDASASTAPANIIYSYTARIRGVDVTLPPEDARPSSYEVGDSVWVKIPHGRCTTQFGKGTVTGVYSPHSVLVDGTPRHVKDVRPVRGADATYCSSASSDNEAPMLYLPREDPIASESEYSDRGQRGPGDTSGDDDGAESIPLRRSSRLKRPAPRCTVCDSQIREGV